MGVSKVDIRNLSACIQDVVKAVLDNDLGPEDPTNYSQLRGRLEASRDKLPRLYREIFYQPFVNELNEIGETGFNQELISGSAGLMVDIAHAILQNGEKYNELGIDGFQEVCADLYDGFLSAEDRMGIEPPDRGAVAPLVKCGRPADGPYTYTIGATSIFGCGAGVVNLPPSHLRIGLLAWAALGHETAGHDILHADTGLHQDLSDAVQTSLQTQGLTDGLPDYWSHRIDETASDVCGILNMGPAAGIGILGYFRGLVGAFGGQQKLRNVGGKGEHPADILRGYLAAYTVRLLDFNGAGDWAQIIEDETNKDLSNIILEGKAISAENAKKSAQIVASTLVNTKVPSLENHALGEIQNWRDHDEDIVTNELVPLLTSMRSVPPNLAEGIYAAHVVAAAVVAALSKNADISSIFSRMIGTLKIMHDKNPSWGPLFVRQPGNMYRHLIYHSFEENTILKD